jgi:hypothetical protein
MKIEIVFQVVCSVILGLIAGAMMISISEWGMTSLNVIIVIIVGVLLYWAVPKISSFDIETT